MKKIIGLVLFILLSTIGWTQRKIEFIYEFEKDKLNSNLFNVTAKIINKSENDIYFLSESCNGLDYYLTTNTPLAEIYIMTHCNATYPKKIELKSGSNYEFKTIVKLNKSVEKIGLNLELLTISKAYKLEGKLLYRIRKENNEKTIKLKGPKIRIE